MQWVYAAESAEALRPHPAVDILRRVWVQHYDVQDAAVHWRHTDHMPSTEHVLHAPYAPAARWSHKRATTWCGYQAQITDACEAERPHVITPLVTTPATPPDAQVTETMPRALAQNTLLPAEHLLERGDVDTPVLIDSEDNHCIAVIGPMQVETTWQAQAGKGFDVALQTEKPA